MAFCRDCGTAVENGQSFCSFCGKKIDNSQDQSEVGALQEVDAPQTEDESGSVMGIDTSPFLIYIGNNIFS